MEQETKYQRGDIVDIKNSGCDWHKVEILNEMQGCGYEWRFYPKQSDNYYHTDYAGEALLYNDTSRIITKGEDILNFEYLLEKFFLHICDLEGHSYTTDYDIERSSIKFTKIELEHLKSL